MVAIKYWHRHQCCSFGVARTGGYLDGTAEIRGAVLVSVNRQAGVAFSAGAWATASTYELGEGTECGSLA